MYFGYKTLVSDKGYYFRDAFISKGTGYLLLIMGISILIITLIKNKK
jgi:hypothetical protein